jgi:hypothetical protein
MSSSPSFPQWYRLAENGLLGANFPLGFYRYRIQNDETPKIGVQQRGGLEGLINKSVLPLTFCLSSYLTDT